MELELDWTAWVHTECDNECGSYPIPWNWIGLGVYPIGLDLGSIQFHGIGLDLATKEFLAI